MELRFQQKEDWAPPFGAVEFQYWQLPTEPLGQVFDACAQAIYHSGARFMQEVRECLSFRRFQCLLAWWSEHLRIDEMATLQEMMQHPFFHQPRGRDGIMVLYFSASQVLYELVRLGRQDVLNLLNDHEDSLLKGFLCTLETAAAKGDTVCMKHCFLQKGVHVNSTCPCIFRRLPGPPDMGHLCHCPPLHVSVACLQFEAAVWLLHQGADPCSPAMIWDDMEVCYLSWMLVLPNTATAVHTFNVGDTVEQGAVRGTLAKIEVLGNGDLSLRVVPDDYDQYFTTVSPLTINGIATGAPREVDSDVESECKWVVIRRDDVAELAQSAEQLSLPYPPVGEFPRAARFLFELPRFQREWRWQARRFLFLIRRHGVGGLADGLRTLDPLVYRLVAGFL